jgi:small conductance mechanosensitive channel
MAHYYQRAVEWLMTSGLHIVLIALMGFLGVRLLRTLSRRLFAGLAGRAMDAEQKKKIETLADIVYRTAAIMIIVVSVMMVLKEFGVDIAPVLAGAGVLGVAVGFGAQHLVQDVISGFFIILDDQIRVNDLVEIAGKNGIVEKINLRITVLRDITGSVHYVRNGQIGAVTNMTKEYSCYVLDLGVAYREDVDEVMAIMRTVDEGLRADQDYREHILAPIEVLGLERFADSSVIIRARSKTRPLQQMLVGREFNRRLKKELDARGIEIPYPQLTLHMGQDGEGGARRRTMA